MCKKKTDGHSNGKYGTHSGDCRTRTSSSFRKVAECTLGVSLPLYCTFALQADETSCRTSRLIASTTFCYGMLYAIIWKSDGMFQPDLSSWVVSTTTCDKDEIASARLNAASEWRSRLLAIVNAVVVMGGSILCFLEWSTYLPESEGWVKTIDTSTHCFASNPITFASLFVGYLQWDLCWLIWHRKTHPDVGSMIHHSIFIAVTHFVLWGTYFRKPFAWLSLTEFSTPFLHLRWLLAATNRKNEGLYFWISLGFAVTFLSTRTIGYGLGLLDVWRSFASWKVIRGLWGVVFGLHLAYLLNLFWSAKVGSALLRTLSSASSKQKKQ